MSRGVSGRVPPCARVHTLAFGPCVLPACLPRPDPPEMTATALALASNYWKVTGTASAAGAAAAFVRAYWSEEDEILRLPEYPNTTAPAEAPRTAPNLLL